MNKQELRGAFSKVQAPDGLFDTVCALEKEQKPRPNAWMIVRRVAAVAAVLAIVLTAMLWPAKEENYITAPGLLTVRAYALDGEEISDVNSTVLTEGIELPMEYYWNPSINMTCDGIPLNLSIMEAAYEGMDVTFEVRLSDGSFRHLNYSSVIHESRYDILKKSYLGKHFVVENNFTIFWLPWSYTEDSINKKYIYNPDFKGNNAYADIIIRADDYIVGYAVVEFYEVNGREDEPGGTFNARVLKMLSFPKLDGEFQNVSELYIDKQFSAIHDEN